jgi:UDP-GlcNAc:undecaprenyl-phosphate GlcNAc-1-phosphate transferase
VICTAFTLAPLSRRKANEAAAELAPAGTHEADATAHFDQLDIASETATLETTPPSGTPPSGTPTGSTPAGSTPPSIKETP